MLVDGRLETKISSLSLRFTRPPSEGGWLDTYTAGFTSTDIENLVTETVGVGVVRRGIDERDTPSFGIGYFNDQQRPQDAEATSSHALYLHGGWTRRRVDQLLAPSRGWMGERRDRRRHSRCFDAFLRPGRRQGKRVGAPGHAVRAGAARRRRAP